MELLTSHLTRAKAAYKAQADKHRLPAPDIQPGTYVWLSMRNLRSTRPSAKLDYQRAGPFRVLAKHGSASYRLDLPSTWRIHPVFHVSLLEPTTQPSTPIPTVHLDINTDAPTVNQILDSIRVNNQIYYFVDWTDLPPTDRSWEHPHTLQHARGKILAFHAANPGAPAP